YYEVLPDSISSTPEQDEFEEEIFEVFDDHNY
ncbi:transcriptional regulator, partial [Klebsiella pneumoniae]|nr:transcriptional regulator [Klebsiella pneumoniae]